MVKKIDSNRPKNVSGNAPIESGKAVGPGAVSGATEVKGVEGKGRTEGPSGSGKSLSSGNREKIFRMISEESTKMFEHSTLPERKKKAIEGAVRMVVDSALP